MKSEIGFGIMLLGIALSNGIFAELSGLIVLVGFGKVVLDNVLKKKKDQVILLFYYQAIYSLFSLQAWYIIKIVEKKSSKKLENRRFLLKFSPREKAARCCVYMELNFRFRIKK